MAEERRALKVIVVGNIAQSLINFRGPLLHTMVKLGHDVIAVAPEDDIRYAEELRRLGVKYRRVPLKRAGLNPFSDLRFMFALRRLISEERPDVFLGYTIKPTIYGNLAARLAGVPNRAAIITGLGYAFGEDSLKQRIVGKVANVLYRLALAGAKVVFFQNPDDRAEFINQRLIEPSKGTIVAGSGVDLDRFTSSEPPPPPLVFLLIARLIREKGIEEFVQAASALKERYPEVRFQLLGPLDNNPTAVSYGWLEEQQRRGIVEYLGVTDDVRPFLQKASVFVLPSYREGTPRTVLEALATGRPVVTTDAPGCRETVLEGINGFLVPPRAVSSLEQAMERFVVDPTLLSSMGAASLELARTKYDVRLVNADMLRQLELDLPANRGSELDSVSAP